MAGVQGSDLTIAVCNAGGLGSLAAAMLRADKLYEELTAISAATDAAYNVNFFCHQPMPAAPQREQRWRELLLPYYEEFGVEQQDIAEGAARQPFSDSAIEVLAEFKPAIVSFHFGLPGKSLLTKLKSLGSKIISTATTVAEAKWLEANGADGVIALGLEAGGHRGMFLSEDITTQVGTFSLLPQVVDAISIPVVAAGGIADANGVNAAMSFGAAAVQVGTAYLLCPECSTSPVHRAALISDSAQHTALTNVFSGRPARSIVNRAVREIGPMSEFAPVFPTAGTALGPLKIHAEARGLGDFSSLWSGQNNSSCREIPAAELTRRLAGLVT
jgi:nitronate monooxygenase